MRHALAVALSFSILAAAMTSVAHAQLPKRTWVSGVGNDANDCLRATPCRTFQGALLKTEAGGEINVLDPGSYGAVDINKSITIDGTGTVAGITSFGTKAIRVHVGLWDIVILRNLAITGGSTGATGAVGIEFESGKSLIIENTRIAGFGSRGVMVLGSAGTGTVIISNSVISTKFDPASFAIGIHSQGGITTVRNSVIAGNWIGLFAENTGVINADSNVLTGNGTALNTNGSTATLRISNNDVYGNLTGFGCGSGVLASAGNNRKGNNVGGTVPACSPTVVITQQ